MSFSATASGSPATCRIDDWADVSPFAGVHQFCRIGRHAFVGPYSIIKQDVMPYSLTSHKPEVEVFGANTIGLGAARV